MARLDTNTAEQLHISASSVEDWWASAGGSVAATQNIEDVEHIWRELEAGGIESPGQSFAFNKAWIEKFDVPRDEQLFVTGAANGKVVALMALRRRRAHGANILTWFHGAHVGCNMPLIDKEAFAKFSPTERSNIWQQMQRGVFGADLLQLNAVPQLADSDYFDGLGSSTEVEHLYRSEFEGWEDCDKTQRTRSRRKHDRQQGAKLNAMGEVSFEAVESGAAADDIMQLLFSQKSVRFDEWGVEDPFSDPEIQQFYTDIFNQGAAEGGLLQGKLHVLRLDGEIVAIRYNLEHGDHVFAMISSMSDRQKLKPGSPGKQNILRAMEEIFTTNHKICDMGAGYSDEKRHWCNVKIPLRNHYVPLTAKGAVLAKTYELKDKLRWSIKNNDRLFEMAKRVRAIVKRSR